MEQRLTNKQIVLGVTGGIAAYKSADLVRRLRDAGAIVRVVMTDGAKQFITPLTMQAVSGHPVHDDLFDLQAEAAMGHIELARWADVILVAPATADFIARLAHGEGNDLLTTLCLATQAPILLAPAMNQGMWKNTLTQENVQSLKTRGFKIVGPGEGNQACGEVGPGRMLEPTELTHQVSSLFQTTLLAGKHIVITSGPTQEAIDPVRFISNRSSGKMGHALAEAAVDAGAKVTFISGPVTLQAPKRVNAISVVTANEMLEAVMASMSSCDIFMSVAAVSDYHVQNVSSQKLAKTDTLNLMLVRNPDIVATVAKLPNKPFVIGFAAETENLLEKAKAKLQNKALDMIIANDVSQLDSGMGSDNNEVTVLWKNQQRNFGRMSKSKLARELILLIEREFYGN